MRCQVLSFVTRALVVSGCGLVVASTTAFAQEGDEIDGGGMGFFQVGYIGLDLDELNGSLSNAGYPSLDESFLTLGGAGYGRRGRVLIGAEGHFVLGSKKTTPNGSTRISPAGGYGLFRLGYSIISRADVDVFPMFGVGGGVMGLEFAERSAPTFDEVLADPATGATLSTGMFLLDLSAALAYRITVTESEEGRASGILVGLQAGYMFASGDSSWTLDGRNDVAGGPSLQLQGFHVELSIGGWARGG